MRRIRNVPVEPFWISSEVTGRAEVVTVRDLVIRTDSLGRERVSDDYCEMQGTPLDLLQEAAAYDRRSSWSIEKAYAIVDHLISEGLIYDWVALTPEEVDEMARKDDGQGWFVSGDQVTLHFTYDRRVCLDVRLTGTDRPDNPSRIDREALANGESEYEWEGWIEDFLDRESLAFLPSHLFERLSGAIEV